MCPHDLPLSVKALSFDSSSDSRLFSKTSSVLMLLLPLVVVDDFVVAVIDFVVDDVDAPPLTIRLNLLSINTFGSFDSAD